MSTPQERAAAKKAEMEEKKAQRAAELAAAKEEKAALAAAKKAELEEKKAERAAEMAAAKEAKAAEMAAKKAELNAKKGEAKDAAALERAHKLFEKTMAQCTKTAEGRAANLAELLKHFETIDKIFAEAAHLNDQLEADQAAFSTVRTGSLIRLWNRRRPSWQSETPSRAWRPRTARRPSLWRRSCRRASGRPGRP